MSEVDVSSNQCFSGEESSFSDITKEPIRKTYISKTCFYFKKFGRCHFGEECRFVHNIPNYNKSRVSVSELLAEKKGSNDGNCFSASDLGLFPTKSMKNDKVCRYFKLGFCEKRNDCNFLHAFTKANSLVASAESVDISNVQNTSKFSRNRFVPFCRHFKKGFCQYGDSCEFFHSSAINSYKSKINFDKTFKEKCFINSEKEGESVNSNPLPCNILSRNVMSLSSLNDGSVSDMRLTEIAQLKKRFPQCKVVEEDTTFKILFQPSDPDWAFDVKKLPLEVHFPKDYPLEMCRVTAHQENQYIPDLLIKHLNASFNEWISIRHEQNKSSDKIEILFRPFLKWMDKNLEELFVSGLKKVKQDIIAKQSGIEYVPPEQLFPSSTAVEKERNVEESSPVVSEPDSPESKVVISVTEPNPPNLTDNNSTKILFQNVELTESAAALTCTKLSIALQCIRCKTSLTTKCAPKMSHSHVCSKCSKNIGVTYESSVLHQFSNVLGHLHLLDCAAVDVNLMECHFLVDCLNCSKQVPTGGVHYGQKHKMWCQFCHSKIEIYVGSIKFQASKVLPVSSIKYAPAKKIQKKIKDPLLKEGEPLPNFGTCKHYKKSYRWLRFPCCGRLYPCDECHDEVEIDHEMKYASRMICGYCAREQPYSQDKPCVHCSRDLTRKNKSHWEGGKGCRNKIQMCREDKQKYAGINKTVSRKAQNAKTTKK